jgi:hypothetical protein
MWYKDAMCRLLNLLLERVATPNNVHVNETISIVIDFLKYVGREVTIDEIRDPQCHADLLQYFTTHFVEEQT